MRWAIRWTTALFGGCLMTGCANVEVHKVDVQKRIAGCDEHVQGFRYYLTRPYLVVSDRVPVATSYLPVELAVYSPTVQLGPGKTLPADAEVCLVAQTPDFQNVYHVYDRFGHLRPDLTPEMVYVLPREATPQHPAPTGADYVDIKKAMTDLIVGDLTTQGTKKGILAQDLATRTGQLNGLAAAVDGAIGATSLKTDLATGDTATVVKAAATKVIDSTNKYLQDSPPWKGSGITVSISADEIAKKSTPAQPTSNPPGQPGAVTAAAAVQLSLVAAPGATPTGQQPPADTGSTPPPPFQVIFLPDFEEQYAIKNCNFLAKTHYKYTFSNGTTLTTMAGDYDSTDVPVEILNTVKALVTSAGEVAKTRMANFPITPKTGFLTGASALTPAYYVRIQQAIEPGVYRVQKSWEKVAVAEHDGPPPEDFCGLFAAIGLPVNETVSVITGAEHDQETGLTGGGGTGSK